jgi:multidrug efflux system outer membrane protein
MTLSFNKPRIKSTSSLIGLLILAGCSLTPTYERPTVETPAFFKEAGAEQAASQWKPAQPAEESARGEWWKLFGDATLNALEEQALSNNQDLKAAAARLAQSRALRQDARSLLAPQVNAGFGPTRSRPSPASQGLPADEETSAHTLWRAQAGVSYEVDLFGRVSSTVDAATANAQRSEALFRSVQLALQADVAQNYFLLRELDAEHALFQSTVSLRTDALKLLQKRFNEGDIGETDVARARAELASAQAELLGVERRRAVAEHALAVLLGKAPADLAVQQQPLQRIAFSIPAGLPSDLLERRPDIAAAERAMAAARRAGIRIGEAGRFIQLVQPHVLARTGGGHVVVLADIRWRAARGRRDASASIV